MTAKIDLFVECGGETFYVGVSGTENLTDVRNKIMDEWDDLAIPFGGQFAFKVNNVYISAKQEPDQMVSVILGLTSTVELTRMKISRTMRNPYEKSGKVRKTDKTVSPTSSVTTTSTNVHGSGTSPPSIAASSQRVSMASSMNGSEASGQVSTQDFLEKDIKECMTAFANAESYDTTAVATFQVQASTAAKLHQLPSLIVPVIYFFGGVHLIR